MTVIILEKMPVSIPVLDNIIFIEPLCTMTSSKGNIFHVIGPLCREFTGHRSFDVLVGLRLYKRLSKKSRRWWFGTPAHSLWRQCYIILSNTASSCTQICQIGKEMLGHVYQIKLGLLSPAIPVDTMSSSCIHSQKESKAGEDKVIIIKSALGRPSCMY